MDLYKLVSFRAWDDKPCIEEITVNLEYLLKKKNKPYENYYHKLYKKVGRKWVEITEEL